MIDELTKSDWTREKLAEEILIARYTSKIHQYEAQWLDQLANILRDGGDSKEQNVIWKEYRGEVERLKETYINPKES